MPWLSRRYTDRELYIWMYTMPISTAATRNATKAPVGEHDAIVSKGFEKSLLDVPLVRCRPGLSHEQIEQQCDDAADGRVDDEQREERRPRHEPADGGPDEPRHVADDPQNAEPLLSLLLRKNVGNHRGVRRGTHFREQSDQGRNGKQPYEPVHRSEQQRAERARHEAEENQLSAPEAIRQPTADNRPEDAGKRQQAEKDTRFSHADVELPGNVERKKREGEGAADFVDEVHADDDPEPSGKLVVEIAKTCHRRKIIAVLGSGVLGSAVLVLGAGCRFCGSRSVCCVPQPRTKNQEP